MVYGVGKALCLNDQTGALDLFGGLDLPFVQLAWLSAGVQ